MPYAISDRSGKVISFVGDHRELVEVMSNFCYGGYTYITVDNRTITVDNRTARKYRGELSDRLRLSRCR